MKHELIMELFQKLGRARYLNKELDCWSGRELQQVLGYRDWSVFLKVIEKVKLAFKNAGIPEHDHFAPASRILTTGKNRRRRVKDLVLTRYACFSVAQRGDAAKSEIAFTQIYFSTQTRTLKAIERFLCDIDRSKSKNKMPWITYQPGTDEGGFAIIRSWGTKALSGGHSAPEMKKKLPMPNGEASSDFLIRLPDIIIDIAEAVTMHNVREKELVGEYQISVEYIETSLALRNMFVKCGIKPEAFPAAENITEIAQRLESRRRMRSKV